MKSAAVPAARLSPRQARIRNWVLFGLLIFAAGTGPYAAIVSYQASSTAEDAMAAVDTSDEPIHRAYAEVAAARWAFGGAPIPSSSPNTLATHGRASLSPGDRDRLGLPDTDAHDSLLDVDYLAWEDADVIAVAANEWLEVHRFIVVTRDGLMRMTLPITDTGTQAFLGAEPALAGNPTIEPYVADARLRDASDVRPPDNSSRETFGANVNERVEEWAEAFVNDQRRDLYNLAGDNREDIEYVGLQGFELDDVSIGNGYRRVDGIPFVEVTLTLLSDQGAFYSRYDVLLDAVNEPLPFIVGWAPSGTAHLHEPFTNARPVGSQPLPPFDMPDSDTPDHAVPGQDEIAPDDPGSDDEGPDEAAPEEGGSS